MKLSNRVDANAISIVTGQNNLLEQVTQAVAGLVLCETLWADGHFTRLSDTQLEVENDLGRCVHFTASAASLDAILALIPTSNLPTEKAAARGMMAIFGVEDEFEVKLGLSLCPAALKLCLLARSINPEMSFERVVEVVRRH
jgi:hypothetical protein